MDTRFASISLISGTVRIMWEITIIGKSPHSNLFAFKDVLFMFYSS